MKIAGLLLSLLVVVSAAAVLPSRAGAQSNAETITLPGSMPPQFKESTMVAADSYPPMRPLELKIHVADLGGDENKVFDGIVEWLKGNGMTVKNPVSGHRIIEVTTDVKTAEALFHVSLDQYEINSMLYYANSQPPSIPVTLNGIITAIDGLDNFPAEQ